MEKQPLRIVWTDPAKHDLQSIYDYLAEISILIAENQIRIIPLIFLYNDFVVQTSINGLQSISGFKLSSAQTNEAFIEGFGDF